MNDVSLDRAIDSLLKRADDFRVRLVSALSETGISFEISAIAFRKGSRETDRLVFAAVEKVRTEVESAGSKTSRNDGGS